MKYTIELVWNREFNWCFYQLSDDFKKAKEAARSIRDSGDGARVKKVRILNNNTGEIVWQG